MWAHSGSVWYLDSSCPLLSVVYIVLTVVALAAVPAELSISKTVTIPASEAYITASTHTVDEILTASDIESSCSDKVSWVCWFLQMMTGGLCIGEVEAWLRGTGRLTLMGWRWGRGGRLQEEQTQELALYEQVHPGLEAADMDLMHTWIHTPE